MLLIMALIPSSSSELPVRLSVGETERKAQLRDGRTARSTYSQIILVAEMFLTDIAEIFG